MNLSTHHQKYLSYYFYGFIQQMIIGSFTLILYFTLGSKIFFETKKIQDTDSKVGIQSSDSIYTISSEIFITFIVLLMISSFILVLVFKKLKNNFIRALYGSIITFSLLLLLYEMYQINLNNQIQQSMLWIIEIVLLLFVIYFFYSYIIGSTKIRTRNLGILLGAVGLGRVVGLYLDLFTLIVFSTLMAIYDLYSVFLGPLSKIIGKPKKNTNSIFKMTPEQFQTSIIQTCKSGLPVYISKNRTQLGIGDILFYSSLLYRATLEFYLLGFFFILIALITGSIITLFGLTKASPLPGLPAPILLSNTILLLFWLANR